MAGNLDLRAPSSFKVLGDNTNLSKAWEQYFKRFEYYLKATGVTKDEQKRALLLHVAGEEVQDIIETLDNTGTKYDQAVAALSDYFKPRKHISFERHVFRHAKQKDDETIDNFIVRLSKLSISCEYTVDQKEDMIRDQVVDGCKSTELRRKLLAVENLTLDKVRKIARTYELSVTHASKMDKGEDSTKDTKEEEVNKVQKKKRTQFKPRGAPRTFNRPPPTNFTRRTAQCYRCGRSGHYGKECQITRDAICRKCGKSGQFAKVCKTKQFTTGKVNSLNQYFEEESDQEIFTLSGKDDAIISIEIEGQSINFLIDSGSSINAIDKQTFEKLKTRKSMLEKTTTKIFPYGSSKPIPLIGKTKMNATVNNETCAIEFHVIAGNGKPLLGRKSATELGLLHIGSVNCMHKSTTDEILGSYQDRFTGLGKLKDFKLELHVDESIKPVAQTARKIPFKMKKQLEHKLKELEDSDVIEKVQGPTPWVSPLVVVPKANSDIRICVDMRCANKAVQRERFPMPNIEDIIQQMNGSSVFSRLDLSQSFHQIELDEKSRFITTFVCHKA